MSLDKKTEEKIENISENIAFVIVGLLKLFIYPYILLLLYNGILLDKFNLPDFTYWEMMGLMIFVNCFKSVTPYKDVRNIRRILEKRLPND